MEFRFSPKAIDYYVLSFKLLFIFLSREIGSLDLYTHLSVVFFFVILDDKETQLRLFLNFKIYPFSCLCDCIICKWHHLVIETG